MVRICDLRNNFTNYTLPFLVQNFNFSSKRKIYLPKIIGL